MLRILYEETGQKNSPEWIQTHRHCPRRGVWILSLPQKLEVCGGREGDDLYLSLQAGEVLTEEKLKILQELLTYPRDARESSL